VIYLAGMFRSLLIILLLSLSLLSFSQPVIKGRVINAATGAGIPGCSVFISNSSKGTVSSAEGYFELSDIMPGKYELVVSSVGYETLVYPFSDAQLPLQLRMEMSIKVQELSNVTVEPFLEEGWDKWGKVFMDNFVGNTENAEQCRIKNTNKIRFRFYKKSNRIVAYADEPIVIENRALGYTIHYQLEDFQVNFSERTTFYLGYPLFEDMTKDGKEPKEKWQKRREEAYKGSVIHFMRSLYYDSLLQEGFEVRRMKREPNTEKLRIRELLKAKRIEGTPLNLSANNDDSSVYYKKILQQRDYKEMLGASLLTADSLITPTKGAEKILYFGDYIYVMYKNELEEDGYINHFMERRQRTYQRSYVSLLNDEAIVIDKAGNYFNPQHFFTSAYWGWSEKMANLLPNDYLPAK
jgi:hypothetical protein